MPKENNNMQVDIENLFKQNVNDLSAIKELYRKLKEVEEKITQIKYIDSNLANKLKKDYESLKKDYESLKCIILDENIQAKLANDIKTINLQLDTIASIPKGINLASEINDMINNNVKTIKIPKGNHYISEPIKLGSGVTLIGDKTSKLYTDKDISIITTKDDNISYDDIYLFGLNISQEYQGVTSYPVINLKNANMCRVEKVMCIISNTNIESECGLKVYSTLTNVGNHGGVFSILIDKCDFRNSSVYINVTDSYITNTNIWGVNRKYALHLGKSSQQISNCQFVGGDEKGAVWIKDIDNDYNIEIIKITNCYFDGSYSDVKSGIGLNAKQMKYSNISNCSFWYQKKDGMLLDECFGNTFVGLTFEGNGRNNLTQNSMNDNNGYADIKIINATYDNIFDNINFAANGNYYIKNKAILGVNTKTFDNHYNILNNLNVIDYDKYDTNNFDFSFPYVGTNIKGTSFKQNIINGTLKLNGELQATTGYKTSVIFSHNSVVSNMGKLLPPNGQTKTNYLVCNNGSLLDIGVNVETGISTGTLTIQVFRNSELLAEQTMDKKSPYFKITNFNYGDKKIYKGDLLKVKIITSDDLNNCSYLTVTINISQ